MIEGLFYAKKKKLKKLFIRRGSLLKAVWVSITNKYYDPKGIVEAIRNKRASFIICAFEWTTLEDKEKYCKII